MSASRSSPAPPPRSPRWRTLAAVAGAAAVVWGGPAGCDGGQIVTGPADSGPDTVDGCDPPCGPEERCEAGRCVLRDERCASIDCPPGTHCVAGACIRDDPCADVVCSSPGEVCQGGRCVSGEADEDGDGFPARVDCDDSDPEVYPGAPERCNGVHDGCDPSVPDGADECPGRCCGAVPACRECCEASQCGPGDWTCDESFRCACDGRLCSGTCRTGASCCEAADCGSGDWTCSADGRCRCSGLVCSGVCRAGASCCEGADCGSGDWTCSTDGRCRCSGLVCSGACRAGASCCEAADCGSGAWRCTSGGECDCPCSACGERCFGAAGACCAFGDVSPSHPMHLEITTICDAGVTSGCGGSAFCPETAITRAEMAIFVVRAAGESPSTAAPGAYFDDVAGHSAALWVNRLFELGITSGCGSRLYCPDDATARRHAAVFVVRAMGESPSTAAPRAYFDDVGIDEPSTPYVNRLFELGVTDGCAARRFCPDASLARAEAARLVYRGLLCP